MKESTRNKLIIVIGLIAWFTFMAFSCCGQNHFQSWQRMEDNDCNLYAVSYVHGRIDVTQLSYKPNSIALYFRSKNVKYLNGTLSFKDGKNTVKVRYNRRMEEVELPSITLYAI